MSEGPERDLIETLPRIYPTPNAMREAADRMANARQDQLASEIVRLMRWLADVMESGELREEGGRPHWGGGAGPAAN